MIRVTESMICGILSPEGRSLGDFFHSLRYFIPLSHLTADKKEESVQLLRKSTSEIFAVFIQPGRINVNVIIPYHAAPVCFCLHEKI